MVKKETQMKEYVKPTIEILEAQIEANRERNQRFGSSENKKSFELGFVHTLSNDHDFNSKD